MTQQQHLEEEDEFLKLQTSVRAESARIAKLDLKLDASKTVEEQLKQLAAHQELLRRELVQTSLYFQGEEASMLLWLREFMEKGFLSISAETNAAIDALDERISDVEGDQSQLTPEHAQVLLDITQSCAWLAGEAMKVQGQSQEGQQKLAQIVALCQVGEKIVNEARIDYDEDEDEDDEEEDEAGDDEEDGGEDAVEPS